MEKLNAVHVDETVSGVRALLEVLNKRLQEVEERAIALENAGRPLDRSERIEMESLILARVNLLSAVQSASEVLQWVKVLAAKDPEGNELECVRTLPQLQIKELH